MFTLIVTIYINFKLKAIDLHVEKRGEYDSYNNTYENHIVIYNYIYIEIDFLNLLSHSLIELYKIIIFEIFWFIFALQISMINWSL